MSDDDDDNDRMTLMLPPTTPASASRTQRQQRPSGTTAAQSTPAAPAAPAPRATAAAPAAATAAAPAAAPAATPAAPRVTPQGHRSASKAHFYEIRTKGIWQMGDTLQVPLYQDSTRKVQIGHALLVVSLLLLCFSSMSPEIPQPHIVSQIPRPLSPLSSVS